MARKLVKIAICWTIIIDWRSWWQLSVWSLPKTTLSLIITPFQHLIGIPWQTHVPVGYPVQSIGENGNYRDNRRRLSGWTLPKSTSYVGLFTSFSSVCLWQRWQIKTNSNDFCKVSGIVCIQSLWSQWREEKSIFRSLHELSMVRFWLLWAWWDFNNNKCGEIFFFMLIMIIVIIMMKYHEMRSYCTITKQPEI